MGFHRIPGTEIDYGLIAYDAKGQERTEANGNFSQTLIEQAAAQSITDVFFFIHGWKGDRPEAIAQYDRWIGALMKSADLARASTHFPGFRPMLIGLHWPSQPWGDEEIGPDGSFAPQAGMSMESLLESYLKRLGDGPEIRGPLQTIVAEARRNISPETMPSNVRDAYLELNKALGLDSGDVDAPPDADREEFDPEASFDRENEEGDDFGGSNLGGLLGPLRQISFWTMKKRARTVGEGGMHQFLKALQQKTAAQGTRIHLMGHSFGTIVVSSMLGGPGAKGPLLRPVDSVVLVQGAVSLWSYAFSIPFGRGGAGYFKPILSDGKIAGPLVTTQSKFDRAVGHYYPLAARFSFDASFVPGLPKFGAIGTFGVQGLPSESLVAARMLAAEGSYNFERGKIYNLDSSDFIAHGDGASGAHSDIDGPEVAHAIWEAALVSKPS